MMQDLLVYLFLGTLWAMISEGLSSSLFTNRTRIYVILFWPIFLGSFIIGFIVGFYNDNFRE
jgi:hypothetical protein